MRKKHLLTTLCALALAGAGAVYAADETAPAATPATAEAGCPEQVVGEAIRGWRLVHDGKGGVCACKDGERIPLYNSGEPELQVETSGDNWICTAGSCTPFVIRVDAETQRPILIFTTFPQGDVPISTKEEDGDLVFTFYGCVGPRTFSFTIPKEIPQELKGRMPYIFLPGGSYYFTLDAPPFKIVELPAGEKLVVEDIGSGTFVYRYSIRNKEGRITRRSKMTHDNAYTITLGEGTCTPCDEKGRPITTLPIQEGDDAPVEFHSVFGQGFGVVLRRGITVVRKEEGYFLIHGPVRVPIEFATPEVQKELDALLAIPQERFDGYDHAVGILHEEITSSGRPSISPWCRAEDLEGTGLTQPDGTFRMQQKIILHRVLPTPKYPK